MSYWPIEELQITEIFLDQKNIRLPISDVAQDALIQDLFINEDALEIAKSICQFGGMFPDEFPIVTKEEGKFVMIEGNRRLAALKALNEPDLVPTFREKLKNLIDPKIKVIRVIAAPDRNTATNFIANRHTINLRRAWKPLRQAYFYYSQLLNGKTVGQLMLEYPGHDVPKFIKMLEMHKLAKSINYEYKIEEIVFDDRRFPITNLERMYNDPYVKAYLKISFNNEGKVVGAVNIQDFLKPYAKIVSDVATGVIDSRKYNTESQRKEYIDSLPVDIEPKEDKSSSFTTDDAKDNSEDNAKTKDDSESGSKEKNASKKRNSTKKRSSLIPNYIKFGLENSALEIVFNELSSIDIAKFPNAAHDLLRSFLETTLATYLKEINELPTKNTKHNPTLDEMLAFIASGKCTTIKDPNLIQVVDHLRQQYNKNYSLVRMNMINHNEHWIATEREVRDAWGKLESVMKVILKSDK